MTTQERLNKEYGVIIVDDSYYNPYAGKMVKQYRILSADLCPWENGLRNLKAVEAECKQWANELKSIMRYAEARRAR